MPSHAPQAPELGENDPEPTWADAIGRAYWIRREEQRQARMSHWRQYLP